MVNIENGEELREYLADRLHADSGGGAAAADEPDRFTLEVLSGGVSNRTVRVVFPSGDAWVIKQALDKLRVPIDWFCSPERAHREALGIQLLSMLLPQGAVPALIFEDRANNILVMEAVREPFSNWKSLLLAGRVRLRTVKEFAGLLAALHTGGLRERRSLPEELYDLTYFWNLRLEPYYRFTAGRVARAREMLEELADGYEAHRQTLVHGDFSPKNILLRRGRAILLDHEVIHVGDPAFDVGFSLTHLLSKAHHVKGRRAVFLRAAKDYWAAYRRATPADARSAWGGDFEQRSVRHTLGCLLARAAGRSQLEYLSDDEKRHQVDAAAGLIDPEPRTIPELAMRFAAALDRSEGEAAESDPRQGEGGMQ